MDNITHSLVGYALGRAVADHRVRGQARQPGLGDGDGAVVRTLEVPEQATQAHRPRTGDQADLEARRRRPAAARTAGGCGHSLPKC